MPIFSDTDTRKILLIGDISRAFSDADAISASACQVYANIPDAIKAAGENSFWTIGVVMSGPPAKLRADLKALRQASGGAKIILLAQMYEEPAAMQLVGPTLNGADDYLICPIHFSHLASYISHPVKPEAKYDIRDTTYDIRVKQLEKLATTDELTGLKSRRYVWEFSRQIIEHASKRNGRVTLLIFDIDNFKHYNDVYGHSAGDEILKQAAVLMQRCCRSHDVVGRIGGDEFAVVFWDEPRAKPAGPETERRCALADHPKEPIFIAERFRRELKKAELGLHFARESKMGTEFHLLGPQGQGVLTISGGLASLARDGSTPRSGSRAGIQQLFSRADKALLEAKRSGKNSIYLVGRPKSDIADIE